MCNMHNMQRLWFPLLKIRVAGSYKPQNFIEFGTKFVAAFIPMVDFNISFKVKKSDITEGSRVCRKGHKGKYKKQIILEDTGSSSEAMR